MLKTVVYTSRSSSPMPPYEVEQLVQASRIRNRACGLTGLLVWSERGFAQCLEGPQDAVDERSATIFADARHRDVRVLLDAAIDRREFPNWSMGYASIYDGGDRLTALEPHFGPAPWGPARTALMQAVELI